MAVIAPPTPKGCGLLYDRIAEVPQVWDLGGQPRFRNIADIFFKGASGMLAVLDVTRRDTLPVLTEWIRHVHSVVGRIPSVIVGNKIDLRGLEDKIGSNITRGEGMRFASKHNSPYVETSAKGGSSVEEAFKTFASRLGQ